MNIAFNALLRLYEQQEVEIQSAIERVLKSGHYILGPEVLAFEAALANFFSTNKEHIVSCNSGTDALILSLKALNVSPGDEVICVSHTAIPTIVAIRAVGATPVFIDIDPNTWVMNLEEAKTKINSKTKAIIAVHLYGNMVNIPGKDFLGVPILEDVAQAMGSTLRGQHAGLIGKLGAFSFYPTKNIGALGDAGAVAANNHESAEPVRMLRNYGQKDRYNALLEGGLNSRLDELQAAILSVRLKLIHRWNAEKKSTVDFYRKELASIPLRFQKITEGCEPAWHLCVIALENLMQRDPLQKHLSEKGVQCLIHYPIPTHQQKAFSPFCKEELPHTESLAHSILSLPLYPGLTEQEKRHVVESIKSFF